MTEGNYVIRKFLISFGQHSAVTKLQYICFSKINMPHTTIQLHVYTFYT